jgi:integrase/recombinase XerD
MPGGVGTGAVVSSRLREAGSCPFFVFVKGIKLHGNTIRGVFRRLVYRLGIAPPENKLRPRLHDLRFYFANQVFTHSPGNHNEIGRHMVALTTYLGHSDIRNSYWHLEATPSLFSKIADQCEDYVNGGHL